ncbi:MAG TPA: hypothetical protein VFJ57_16200 [Solirubrobacterales bacterium]|nr:hypothetical protein [Solirubrobacterales bacterium]
MAFGFVPGAPRQQRFEDVLAELGPELDHVAQPLAVEGDHPGRLDRDAGADRRLAGEDRDVADEGAAVGLGDVDVLARLAVDELDQALLEDEERGVAHRVLVKHLAGLERLLDAALAKPVELPFREPWVDDPVGEVGEGLAADYSGRGDARHVLRACQHLRRRTTC